MTERGLILLNESGDLEITWEPENDAKMRAIIEKKMKEGVRFFIMKPLIGNFMPVRSKMTNLSQLKDAHITIRDADIETMFKAGDVSLFRNSGANVETTGVAKTADQVINNRTVGVKALQGG